MLIIRCPDVYRITVLVVVTFLALIFLSGCSDNDPFAFNAEDPTMVEDAASTCEERQCAALAGNDRDHDGLSDGDEQSYGTNPDDVDTDGDGMTDCVEIRCKNFDPAVDPYTFNPLIADIPVMSVKLLAMPTIDIIKTESTGETLVATNTSESSITNSVTTSQSESSSTTIENNWSWMVGTSYTFAEDPEFTIETSVGLGGSTARGESFQWDKSQETANSQAYSESHSYEQNYSSESLGGYIAIPIRVTNEGVRSFTVDSLILSANEYLRDPVTDTQTIQPVANLEYDTSGFNSFPQFTLSPGDSTDQPLFFEADLDLRTAQALLKDSANLHVGVASHEISDFDGRSFAFQDENIQASTAHIIIDYSRNNPILDYLVATRISDDNPGVLVGDILTNLLNIKFTTDPQGMLTSMTDPRPDREPVTYSNDSNSNSEWVVLHSYLVGGNRRNHIYRQGAEFDFAGTMLQARDVLQMVYVQDTDGDGLGDRQEFVYSCSPDKADTDGDGWSDGKEVFEERTRPDLADTDGDGLSDSIDSDPLNPPSHTSSTINDVVIFDASEPPSSSSCKVHEDITSMIYCKDVAGERVTFSVTTKEPVSLVSLDETSLILKSGTDSTYTLTKGNLPLGENVYDLQIVSEDGSSRTEYKLVFQSTLQDIEKIDVIPMGLANDGDAYNYNIEFSWGDYMDTRADGALLLYRHDSLADSVLQTIDELYSIKDDSRDAATEFSSGEMAVKKWEVTPTGEYDLAGDYFFAYYYGRNYAFRVVTYAWDAEDGCYHFSSGVGATVKKMIKTPLPSRIQLDRVRTKINWERTGDADKHPEFIMYEKLLFGDKKSFNAEDNDVDEAEELCEALSSCDKGDDECRLIFKQGFDSGCSVEGGSAWQPGDGSDNPFRSTKELEDKVELSVAADALYDHLFSLIYAVDEDESLGEHQFVLSRRDVQFHEKDGDGMYGLSLNHRYADSTVIDTQSYKDKDKGDLSFTWTVDFKTLKTAPLH